MRRSAAPSKLQPLAKRPRFVPTFNKDKESETGHCINGISLSPHLQPSQPISGVNVRRLNGSHTLHGNGHTPVMGIDEAPCSGARLTERGIGDGDRPNMSTTLKQPAFRSPLSHVRVSTPAQNRALSQSPYSAGNVNTPLNTDSSNRGYFSVMWCKASKKKHKKWEGDAVLVTHGRTAVLYDMESKEIGRATGYKATELSSLKEDETLFIGGKEIQVMSIISEENYKSGKCFMTDSPVTNTETPTACPPAKVSSKPFVNPCRDVPGSHGGTKSIARLECTEECAGRFDPTAPGALVMSRPSSSHQWEYNKKELAVVDVVVDPYLSVHLRPHQREGIAFLYECLMGMRNYNGCGAILADDMGLGKTLQCIALLWTLLRQGPYGGKAIIKKVLIITPGSLVKNWKQEFKKWLGTERLHTFAVGQDNRVEEFVKGVSPVMIISYEMFVRSAELISSLNFDIVICDEGHRLKNTTIKTTSLIMSLPTRRRIVLTGTPIQNDLQEFYSIVEFVNPGVLGSSAAFRSVYEEPIVSARQPSATTEDVELGEKRASELARLTKLFVIRRTQDINNKYLLPKVDIVVFCRPSPLQLSLYRKLLGSRLIRSCLNGTCNGSPHLVCIAALKKVCNHPSLIYQNVQDADMTARYTEDEDTTSIYNELLPVFPERFDPVQTSVDHSGKLQALAALLHSLYSEGPRERLVLVSNHTKTLDLLQQFCVEQGYKFLRLDGQTPTAQRQGIVQRFNSTYAQEFIFLLSSKAGGVGLNLIGASRLVLYDIDWNPANDLQAMARVWRDGQKRRVYIYRFITTGSLEEKIYQRQISKQGLSGAVMDIKDKNDVQFSLEDLRDLFTLNERTLCETHDLLNCDCDNTGSTVKETTVQPSGIRACQLGGSSNPLKSCRNLTMDELMDWHHTTADPATLPPEWHLSQTRESVTCVFWNEAGGRERMPVTTTT